MAKGNNNLTGRKSHGAKPYDANNSFVKKVATKVTDFIPQRSWISKWFNVSQDNGDASNDPQPEESELEEEAQLPPPVKRARIRTGVTHPPGTFDIQPRNRTSFDKSDLHKTTFPMPNEDTDDFLEPLAAGPSGIRRFVSSTPAVHADVGSVVSRRADLNSLVSPQNNGAINGTDDNSESSESTSGCSSLIPQTNRQEAPSNMTYNSSFDGRKRFMDDKLNFTNHLQSPRSLFLESSSRDTLSNRRPSFNASMMNSTPDRASSLSSPFYSGNVTFGGANAAGLHRRSRSLFNSSNEFQLKVPRRTSVRVKPSSVTETDSSGMSQTAKRILETLEHFSSPIVDAKKIPLGSTNHSVSPTKGRKRPRNDTEPPPVSTKVGLRHLTRELTVPTVPDLLKLRRRQKLQGTTDAARKIVSARNGPPPVAQEYSLRSGKDGEAKYHGKLKTKTKTNYNDEETVEAVNLPNIALPISSLPSFDIALPRHSGGAINGTVAEGDTFKFASPIRVAESTKNFKSINNFTFSKPLDAETRRTMDDSNDSSFTSKTRSAESNASTISYASSSSENFMWSGSSTAPRPKEKFKDKDSAPAGMKVAGELKSGSVMDVLGKSDGTVSGKEANSGTDAESENTARSKSWKTSTVTRGYETAESESPYGRHSGVQRGPDKTDHNGGVTSANVVQKSASEIWECNQCLLRNSESATHCVACRAAKPGVTKSAASSEASSMFTVGGNALPAQSIGGDCFGSQFKMSSNQWECSVCLVRNKQTDNKCVSCTTPKPGNNLPLESTKPKETAVEPVKSDIMERFKAPEGSWECPGCMLRNSSTAAVCPCCTTPKPGVREMNSQRNTSDSGVTSGATDRNTSASDLNASGSSNYNLADKLKPAHGSWECPCCLVRNPDSSITCPCCNTTKPGVSITSAKKETSGSDASSKTDRGDKSGSIGSGLQFRFDMSAEAGSFKFGIDKTSENQTKADTLKPPTSGFAFGVKSSAPTAGQFSFGIPKDDNKAATETSNTGFTFAAAKMTESDMPSQLKAKSSEPAKIQSVNETTSKSDEVVAPSFSFGVPKTETSNPPGDKPFAFGVSAVATANKVPVFSFGASKSEANTDAASTESPKVTFGVSSVASTKSGALATEPANTAAKDNLPPTTGSSTVADIGQEVHKSAPAFSFVASNTMAAAGGVSTTAVATNSALPAPSQASFSFTGSKSTTEIQTPSFAEATAPTSSSSAFVFGGSKAVKTSSATPEKKPTSFGNSAPTTAFSVSSSKSIFSGSEVKSIPAFGSSENKPVIFGTIENKIPAFGSADNNKASIFGATENKAPPPSFGSTDKSAPLFNAPPASAFGASTANATPFASSSSTPVFGSSSLSGFGERPAPTTDIFSTTKSNENATPTAANPCLFTFSSSSSQPTPTPVASSGFSFNASTSAVPPAQKSLFSFGNNSNQSQTGSGFGGNAFNPPAAVNTTQQTGFSFSASKPTETPAFGQQNAPPSASIFGSPTTAPDLGQGQAAPSFGSAAPTPGTEFAFGASAPAAPSSGYNFGSAASTGPPSGGFSFSTPNLDPNTRPSFNFTGGSAPIAFNAPPQSPALQQRRIKKAVRRVNNPR